MMSRTEAIARKAGQRLPALGCALAVLVTVAVAHPAGEIPMGDEIIYARSAQILAQTGHITYVGWINAMAGWHLCWGRQRYGCLAFRT